MHGINLLLNRTPPKIIATALCKKNAGKLGREQMTYPNLADLNPKSAWAYFLVLVGVSFSLLLGVESGRYRLLSITQSVKLILVSQVPSKTKYVLDASTSKITVDG